MKECSDLRNKVLGSDHPDAKSSSRVLSDWMNVHNSSADPMPLIKIHHQCVMDGQDSGEVC
jgi:hypothetical protein